MYENLALFIFGASVLLISTYFLVRLALRLSLHFRVSTLILGITIMAIGTSLPELTVAVTATLQEDSALTLGNLVGANIINILLIFPIGVLLGKLRVGTQKTQRNSLILLVATGLFVLFGTVKVFVPYRGLLLIFGAFCITLMEYWWAVLGRKHEDALQFFHKKRPQFTPLHIIALGLATLGVVMGGIITTDAAQQIANITSRSTTFIGMTLLAVATTLPEMLVTIFGQNNKTEKVTLGNILGSDIYNMLLIGGVVFTLSSSAMLNSVEVALLLFVTVIFALTLFIYRGREIPRGVAALYFILFLFYITLLRVR